MHVSSKLIAEMQHSQNVACFAFMCLKSNRNGTCDTDMWLPRWLALNLALEETEL